MIQMGEDGKVRWNKLRYSMGDIGNTMQDGMENPQVSRKTNANMNSALRCQHCRPDRNRCTVHLLPQ